MKTCHYVSSPMNALSGEINVPGDKSISHRAIIFGAIAVGKTIINGCLMGEDCLATLQAFLDMGVVIEQTNLSCLVIHGVGKYGLKKPHQAINCGNSGTSMRLLAGLLAAQSFDTLLTGDNSLLRRPMKRISHPLQQMGALLETHDGCAPLVIQGGKNLQGITYDMPEASAQVKSCLLLAGLYASGETMLFEPQITRDHTERMLTTFSYPFDKSHQYIRINNKYECQGVELHIPGDLSSAAFFIVAATLIPQSKLWIRGVGINPTRTGILQILRQMGAHIQICNQRWYGEEPVADLYITHASLKGIDIPSALVPLAIDEFPILLIAAACARGQTLLQGANELRFKESDRIHMMANGLRQLSIEVNELDDGICIQGGALQGGVVDSGGDHRIAMAFAVAGALASTPVTILQCGNIATSFPNFLTLANQINMMIRETDDAI